MLLCVLGFAWCGLLPNNALAVEPLHPASLEASVESRFQHFQDESSHTRTSHELSLKVGLGWTPCFFMTIHGAIEGDWFYLTDGPVSYRYHNTRHEMQHLGAIGVVAAIDFHPESRIVSLRGELAARSYIQRERAGMFLVTAGAGIGVQPFFLQNETLKTVRFGVMCRFALVDDFEKVFGVERDWPEMVLELTFGF